MNLQNLATLKEKLVKTNDFAAIMDYFMTEFGDHAEFMDEGERAFNKMLEAALCEIGKEAFPDAPAVVLDHVTLVELPAYNFTHGALFVNRCMSTMFYFSDVQMGMLAVAMSMSGPTKFLRFSGKLLAPNLAASDN